MDEKQFALEKLKKLIDKSEKMLDFVYEIVEENNEDPRMALHAIEGGKSLSNIIEKYANILLKEKKVSEKSSDGNTLQQINHNNITGPVIITSSAELLKQIERNHGIKSVEDLRAEKLSEEINNG